MPGQVFFSSRLPAIHPLLFLKRGCAKLRHRFGSKGSADLATSSHPFQFIKMRTYMLSHLPLEKIKSISFSKKSTTTLFHIDPFGVWLCSSFTRLILRCFSLSICCMSSCLNFILYWVHHVMTVPARLKRRGHTPILFGTLKILRLPIIDTSAFEVSLCLRTSFLPCSDQNTVSVSSGSLNPHKPAASQHYRLVFK